MNNTFSLEEIKSRYEEVYFVIAPPRTSSTAFVRAFWSQPSVGFYCHEPFDLCFHKGMDSNFACQAMASPLNLANFIDDKKGKSLIVKEMTFQVGKFLPLLVDITSHPLIFILRDPRLSIFSKMNKRKEGGQDPVFPFDQTGWSDLMDQVAYCKDKGISYVLIDSKEFRSYPEQAFKLIFDILRLPYSEEMLQWNSAENIEIGNLWSEQGHFYERVLKSKGILPPTEEIPILDLFPSRKGFRNHVENCLKSYEQLLADDNTISV